MNASEPRPAPTPDATTRRYWEAAANRELLIKRCRACDAHHFYPRTVCPHCLSDQVEWVEASGRGTVYSYTEVHRAPHPGLASRVPYLVALVELEEGPRMMANLIDCQLAQVSVGAAVQVDFEPIGETLALPVFRLSAPR